MGRNQPPSANEVIERLRALGSEAVRAGQARVGITTERAFGVQMTALRTLAREIGRDQALAAALWQREPHEARLLAALIAEPRRITRAEIEA